MTPPNTKVPHLKGVYDMRSWKAGAGLAHAERAADEAVILLQSIVKVSALLAAQCAGHTLPPGQSGCLSCDGMPARSMSSSLPSGWPARNQHHLSTSQPSGWSPA